MKEEKEKYINLETGEFIEIGKNDRIKIISNKQQEAIDKSKTSNKLNKETKELNKNLGGFVFLLFKYGDEILSQHKEINSEDITRLFYLATYVDFKGYLIYEDGFMIRKCMQELLKMSREKFTNYFNKMKKCEIFIIDEFKNIKINKNYFTKGEIDNEIKEYYGYTRLYINTIRYLFENVIDSNKKRLGNYFKLIPYIHRQSNVLCLNPNSRYEEIQIMTLYELKEIMGYSKNGVRGFINELFSIKLKDGSPMIGFFVMSPDFWKSVVVVNPKIVYGGNYNLDGGVKYFEKWFQPELNNKINNRGVL